MKKTIRLLCLLIAAVMSLTMLSGCKKSSVPEKQTVSIALWSDQLTEYYTGYLQSRFPEVDFEFYVATNSTDFYRFKEKNGDLPDILTVRRFSLNDVADWRGSLMDLSSTELANMYYQSYLHNYTYSDGTLNWLPAAAEVDSLLINKTVLEENGLDVPHNYEQFKQLCVALKEKGVRPFYSNFGADYTCMEILQGLSASALTSGGGREWRQQYESGHTDQLDEAVWLPVFERMKEFIEYTGLADEESEDGIAKVYEMYKNHEFAIMRGTAEEARQNGVDGESLLMPYFGSTEEENRYLTYPAFQVAANASAEKDPDRKKLILDIMTAMLDDEGLRHITNGQNLISYSKDSQLEFSPMLSEIQPYIESNRLYIRLASSDMFSASKLAVQKMLSGECPDARSAFDAFNAAMGEHGGSEDKAAHIDKSYDYKFDPQKGSAAASAVMNTMREELETQLIIGQAINVAGSVKAGDYTRSELNFLTMGETLDTIICEMTEEQLRKYIEYYFTGTGKRGVVVNDSTLYVTGGFETEIQKTDEGYSLEALTINGKKPPDGEVYSVALIGNETLAIKDALAAAGVDEYTRSDKTLKQTIAERLAGGRQLAEPTDYITLK